jgi:hypothetical protein
MVEVPMKRVTVLSLLALLMTFATLTLPAQQDRFPDITGTWVGETDLPSTPDKDPVTLVLKKAGGSFAGTIAVGKAKEVVLENVKIDDEDTFSFEFSLALGEETNRVKAKLDVINDRLVGNKLLGSWTMDDGSYGALDLQRKK